MWRNLLLLFVLPQFIFAHNLGVHGKIYPIQEADLKEVIVKQASQVNWNKVGHELKTKTVNFTKDLSPANLPIATKNKTDYVDPSVALDRDIWVGNKLLYKKGTWVNPLRFMRPHTDMLFFNANDEAQRQLALKLIEKHPYKIMLVVTQGDLGKLSKLLKMPVYYAYPRIIKRFHITQVPTLMGTGTGGHYLELALTHFAKPYHADWLMRCLHGCVFKEADHV